MGLHNRKSLEPYLPDEIDFYPHQVEGIRQLAQRSSFLLADDMGLGKSLQALVVFIIDVYRGWANTAIIVCPVSLKGNWADEIQKFTRLPYVVLNGSVRERELQLLEYSQIDGPKILIVNYEQVRAHGPELDALGFDVAIFDEAHYMKNPKSQRTKACLALTSRRSFMLTGTPMLNHVDELWTLLHKIDPKAYPKYWSFVNRYAVFGGYKDKQIVGVKNEKELTERLQGVMLRRLKKDVLSMDEPHIIDRRVDLLPEQKKLYDEVVNEMRLPRADQADPDDIENALTKFLRLKQICGTTLPFTGVDISGKLDLAVEDAIEVLKNGRPIVTFTQFRDVQEAFCARLDKEFPQADIWELHGGVKAEDRGKIVKEWSAAAAAGKPGAIVCMLQVAGVGLNMVAASTCQFLDELFVPGLNRQAIDRLNRIGQTEPVTVLRYITRGTVEVRVRAINTVKDKLFEEIVESDPDWKRKLYENLLEDEDDDE
jgi:SNF2 family DNA or RNA helicase